jgi:hypothetical protein
MEQPVDPSIMTWSEPVPRYDCPTRYPFDAVLQGIPDRFGGVAPARPKTLLALQALSGCYRLEAVTGPGCPRCPDMAQLASRLARRLDEARLLGLVHERGPERQRS